MKNLKLLDYLKENTLVLAVLLVSTYIFCFNFLTNPGMPATFDGVTHASNIAQFNKALKAGDFPVRWLGSSANYGMPFGIFSQQTVAYLGALLLFLIPNTLTVFDILIFVFAFLSGLAFYTLLREYFDRTSSLVSTLLFFFAPYRIINVYIRGAIPEFAASLFLPLILLSIKRWVEERKEIYYIVLILCLALLFLTHPISAIVFSVFVAIYFLLLVRKRKDRVAIVLRMVVGVILALGIASYYLLPLTKEISYLNQGAYKSIFVENSSLNLTSIFKEKITINDYLHIGSLEGIILLVGFIYLIRKISKKVEINPLLIASGISFVIYFFCLLRFSEPMFIWSSILGNIQHQWRFLSGIIFIPPIFVAFVLSKLRKRIRVCFLLLIIGFLIIFRIPGVKAFKYINVGEEDFLSSKINLYSEVMNTVWTESTKNYPIKSVKGEILEGGGAIINRRETNSRRDYEVKANETIKMIDNTFYFPGWKVYVDGQETPIEFQDINHRGVVTYKVPEGRHDVRVVFGNTKTRLLGNVLSTASVGVFLALIILVNYPKKRSILSKIEARVKAGV